MEELAIREESYKLKSLIILNILKSEKQPLGKLLQALQGTDQLSCCYRLREGGPDQLSLRCVITHPITPPKCKKDILKTVNEYYRQKIKPYYMYMKKTLLLLHKKN
jgi:hypothetical protein